MTRPLGHAFGRFCLRTFGRGCVNLFSCMFLATILVVLAVGVRLSAGPVSLDGLIKPAERALNAELGGWRVEIGGAAFRWGREQGDVGIRLYDVVLFNPDGARAAGAPEASARFALGPALRGVVAPISARLHGADALLVRTPEGQFRFAFLDDSINDGALAPGAQRLFSGPNFADRFEPDDIGEGDFAAITQIVEGLTGDRNSAPGLERFRSVDVSNLRLFYRDEMSGRFWAAPNASLRIDRTERGLEAELAGDVLLSPDAPPLSLSMTGLRTPGAESVTVSAQFLDAPGDAIASQIPNALSALNALDGGVSGDVTATMRLADGAIERFDARLSTANAMLHLDDAQTLKLDRLAADLSFDAATDRFEMARLEATVDAYDTRLSGAVDLERGEDLAILGAKGAFRIDAATVSDPAAYDQPLKIDDGVVEFDFDVAQSALTVSRFALASRDVEIGGAAEIGLDGDAPRIDVIGEIGAFPAADLSGYWPKIAAPGAWRWVDANIDGGDITGARFVLAASDVVENFAIDFEFRDLEGRYLQEMTPITGAAGHGRATLDAFALSLTEGRVDYRSSGGNDDDVIELAGSRFSIPTFDDAIPPADILIRAEGPIRSVLTLIDEPPLSLVGKLGLDPKAVRGRATVDAALAFPLAKALKIEDVSATATATMQNVAARAPGLDVDVSAPRATLEADTASLQLSAPRATIDGTPASIRWREIFRPEAGAARRSFTLTSRLDREALTRLGAPAGAIVGGSVAARGTAESIDGRPTRVAVDLDLEEAALEIAPIEWFKPVGAPGTVAVKGRVADGAVELTDIAAEIADLSLSGSASIGAGGAVRRVTLDRISIGPDTRLAAEVTPLETGSEAEPGWRVDLSGSALDLADAAARAVTDDAAQTPTPPSSEGGGEGADSSLGVGVPVVVKAVVDSVRLSETALLKASSPMRGSAPLAISKSMWRPSPKRPTAMFRRSRRATGSRGERAA